MKKGVLSDLSVPGTEIEVRVTPNAACDDLHVECMGLKVFVTDDLESEAANLSATRVVSEALGIASDRVHLVRGETSQDKVFRVEA